MTFWVWIMAAVSIIAASKEILVESTERRNKLAHAFRYSREFGITRILSPEQIQQRRGMIKSAEKCRYIRWNDEHEVVEGRPRTLKIKLPECADTNASGGFTTTCHAMIDCAHPVATFRILHVFCTANKDGSCPDARSCALRSAFDSERPSLDKQDQSIMEPFPYRGGQEVPLYEDK